MSGNDLLITDIEGYTAGKQVNLYDELLKKRYTKINKKPYNRTAVLPIL